MLILLHREANVRFVMLSAVSISYFLEVLKLTCEVGPWEVYRDSGRVFNSALELKVHRKRIPLVGLALTLQLMEAISPCATPYTIFWSAPHTGLSR